MVSWRTEMVRRADHCNVVQVHVGRPGLFLIGDDFEKNGNILYFARNAKKQACRHDETEQ